MALEFSADFSKLHASIDRLIKGLDKMERRFQESAKEVNSFDRLFGNTRNFDEFITSVNRLDKVQGAAFGTIAHGLSAIAVAMNSLPQRGINNSKITSIVTFITAIKDIDVSALSESRIAALRSITSVISSIARLPTGSGNIDNLATVGLKIKTLINEIGKINPIDPAKMATIQNMSSLLNSLVRTQKVGDDLNPQGFKKVGDTFKSLGTSFRLSGAFMKLIPGQATLDDMGDSFDKISRSLLKFQTFGRNFEPGTADKVTKTYTKIGVGLKVISSVMSLLPGQASLDNMSKVFDRLGRGLSAITKVADKPMKTKELINLFKAFLAIGLSLRLATKAMGDTGKIDVLSKAVAAVGTLFASLKGESDQGFDSAAFKSRVESVVDGINLLRHIKIDTKRLDAIGRVMEAMAKSSTAKLSQFKEGISKNDLIGAITGGILRRDVIVFVANAVGEFLGHLSRLQIGIAQGLLNIGGNLRQFGQTMIGFGVQINNSFGIPALLNSAQFQGAVDFDRLSSEMQTFGDLTDEELVRAQAYANEIGIQYPLSSNEALTALINLTKAGLDLNDTFSALPSAADLASVSDNKNIDETSRLLIQAAGSFDQFTTSIVSSYENISVAADIIARGANNSTASVESIGAALQNVGPTANSFGLSLEETVAMIGLLENAGIRGAEAGSQLKSMLIGMTRDVPAVRAAYAELGITIEDSNGNFKDANTLLNELIVAMTEVRTVTTNASQRLSAGDQQLLDEAQAAFAAATRNSLIYQNGLSASAVAAGENEEVLQERIGRYNQAAENSQATIARLTGSQAEAERITSEISRTQADNFRVVQQIAGSFGQGALNVLIGQGEDAIANFVDEMGRMPTAAEQAALMMDNFAGDAEQLRGSVETLTTRALLPLIHRAFRPLVQIARKVVDFFNAMPQPVIEIASNVILLVTGIASLVSIASIAIGVVVGFGGVILQAAGGLLLLSMNIPLVIAAVAGFIASFAILIVVATAVATVLISAAAILQEIFSLIENNVGGAGDAFDRLKRAVGNVVERIGDILSIVGEITTGIFEAILGDSEISTGERLAEILRNIAAAFERLKFVLDQVVFLLNAFSDFLALPDAIARAEERFASFIDLDADSMGRRMALGGDAVMEQYMKLLDRVASLPFIKSIFGEDVTGQEIFDFFTNVKAIIQRFARGLRDTFSGLFGLIFNVEGAKAQLEAGLTNLLGLAASFIQSATGIDLSEAITSFDAGKLSEGVSTLVRTVLTFIKDQILLNEGGITDALLKLFQFANPLNGIISLLNILGLQNIAGIFQELSTMLVGFLKNTLGVVFDVLDGQSLGDAIIGNFGSAGQRVIRLLKSVGDILGTIFGIFSSIFSPTGGPGGLAGGLDIGEIIDSISNAFEWFVVNVLTPIKDSAPLILTALENAFNMLVRILSPIGDFITDASGKMGDVIKNFLSFVGGEATFQDFANSIGGLITAVISNVPDIIGGAMVAIGTAIGSTFLVDLGTAIKDVDATAAIDLVAGKLLELVNGALDSLGTLISDAGTTLNIDWLVNLGQAIKDRDAPEIVTAIAEGIVSFINLALNSLGDFIILSGNALDLSWLSDLGQAIKDTNLPDAVNAIAEGIASLISAALELITTAMILGGETLNLDFLIELGNAIKDGDFPDVVTAIAEGIKEIIVKAFGLLPSLLIDIGAGLDIGWMEDFGVSLQTSIAFQMLANAIGNLASYPLEIISSGMKGISDALEFFRDEPASGAIAAIVVGIIALTVAIPFLLPMLSALVAAFAAFFVPVLIVVGIVVLIKNALENLELLLKGDIAGFIGTTFIGMSADILGFFGIDIPEDKLVAEMRVVFGRIETLINTIVDRIRTSVQNIFDGLVFETAKAIGRIELLGGLNTEGMGADIFAIDEQFIAAAESGVMTPEQWNTIGDIMSDNIANNTGWTGILQAQLRTQFEQLFRNFTAADLPAIARENPVDFDNMVATMIDAGGLTEAAVHVADEFGPEFLGTFMDRAIAVGGPALKDSADALMEQLVRQATDSDETNATPEMVIEISAKLVAGGIITPEEGEAWLLMLQKELDLIASGGAITEVEADVTVVPGKIDTRSVQEQLEQDGGSFGTGIVVTPDVQINTGALEADEMFPRQVQETVQQAVDTSVDDITVDIAPALDLTSAEDAGAFSLSLQNLQTDLVNTAIAVDQTRDAVANYGISLGIQTVIASAAWLTHSFILITSATLMKTAIDQVMLSYTDLTTMILTSQVTFPTALTIISNSFLTMELIVVPSLQRVIEKVQSLATEIGDVILDFGDLGTASGTDMGLTVGDVEGRAGGGNVFRGRLYEVVEDGLSELFQIGKRTFLIPGQNGSIVPLSTASNQVPAQAHMMTGLRGASASSSGNVHIDFHEAPVTVQVSGAGANADQVAERSARAVRRHVRQERMNIERKLKLMGSS